MVMCSTVHRYYCWKHFLIKCPIISINSKIYFFFLPQKNQTRSVNNSYTVLYDGGTTKKSATTHLYAD